MRTALSSLLILISVVCTHAAAQSQPAAQTGQTAGQAQAEQSPDLAEAERLTREVVQLYKAGKFEEALPAAERALALREKALGTDSVEAAKSLSNLAALLYRLGKYDRAREAYERALPIFESKLGTDDELTNRTREDLAHVYSKRADYKKAQSLLEAALTRKEKSLGPENESVTRTLVDLAYVYTALQDEAKRDATYERLLDLAEKNPAQTLKLAYQAFNDYSCSSTAQFVASAERKKIEKRIQQLRGVPEWGESVGGGDAAGRIITGGVLNGKALSKPQPGYPSGARNERVQGAVVVRVVVDETGKVIKADAISGPTELQAAAVTAARGWKFSPTLLCGEPVKVTGSITFNFTLQ